MRRLLLAARAGSIVLGVVLLGTAGCSTDQTPSARATPQVAGAPQLGATPSVGAAKPGSAGAGNGDAALSGNTPAICNQAAKTGGQFGSMFAQDRKLLVDAEAAKDQDLAGKVQQKATRDVENYAFALSDMSKLAADPVVKQTLAGLSTQVTALKGDVHKIDDKKLADLRATLGKACGG